MAYLVEYPVSALKDHLESNVGPILNAGDPRRGGLDVNTSRRATPLEITNDELVCTGSGAEVVK